MEQCPNCGEPIRPGARFCTSCRFELNGEANTDAPAALGVQGDGEGTPGADSEVTEIATGWPSPPSGADASTWARTATLAVTAEETDTASAGNDWQRRADDASPEATPNQGDTPSAEISTMESAAGFWSAAASEREDDAANPMNASQTTPALARAQQLLDELRHVITAVNQQARLDLSGVISNLEVAVTPPGALAADDLAELREALLRAREHPRDLDTVIELSQRIDGIVSLMFAYDRAIAAIERSLEVLRHEPAQIPGSD